MPPPTEQQIRRICVQQLGMANDLLVAPCRYNYELNGYLGVDAETVALAIPRPDGTLAMRSYALAELTEAAPSSVIGVGFAFNMVVDGEFWRVGRVAETAVNTLAAFFARVPGMEELAEATSESREAVNRVRAEQVTDVDAAPGGDSPWYASVSGPAADIYSSSDLKAVPDKKPPPSDSQRDSAPSFPLVEHSPDATGGPDPAAPARAAAGDGSPAPAGPEGGTAPASTMDFDRLVTHWRSKLNESPDVVEPYRQLCRLYYQAGDVERAYWYASVLSHFGVAQPAEKQVYERYRHTHFISSGKRIGSSMWVGTLTHPIQDPWPGAFFALLSRAVGTMMGRSLRSYGLKHKDRRDLENDKLLVTRVFKSVHELLDLMEVDFYVDPEADSDLMLANVLGKTGWRPCFVAGARMLRGRSEQELAFVVARDLCFLRPEHLVALLVPSPAHQSLLMNGAIRLVRPDLLGEENEEAVQRQADVLGDLLYPDEKKRLAELVEEMAERRVAVELDRWNLGVQLTSHRIGLLAAQDLAVAARLLPTEPRRAVPITAEERLRELLLFAVSEKHFQAREKLGIAWKA